MAKRRVACLVACRNMLESTQMHTRNTTCSYDPDGSAPKECIEGNEALTFVERSATSDDQKVPRASFCYLALLT